MRTPETVHRIYPSGRRRTPIPDFSRLGGPILFIALPGLLCAQQSASWQDPSPHSVQFVAVAPNVRLEVLDWGGTGRPLVLLAGGRNTSPIYAEFAPKLTPISHISAISPPGP